MAALRSVLTFVSYRLVGAIAGRLPAHVGFRLAEWAGPLLYALSPRLRQNLTDNLRHVLGPDADPSEVQAVVRRACVHVAKGHYDLFRLPRLSADKIEAQAEIEGWEHLVQALSGGRGAIIFSAHMGAVDLVMQLAVLNDIPTIAPVLRTRPERLFRWTRGLRQSYGLRLIPTDEPMLPLARALKRGELVGLAADRVANDDGHEVEFFGSPTRLPPGPVRLSLRSGAPLLPAFAVRRPDNSFRVEIGAPLELVRTGNPQADVEGGMRMMVATVEAYIRRYPEQWLVAVPVWPDHDR
jgi:lauroyl/myristoyl acyltransferase